VRRPLPVIPGVPPSGPVANACAFHPRCPYAIDRCRLERPGLDPVDSTGMEAGHSSACWRAVEIPTLANTIAVPS
jgi:ABC-type dipeptide/oligopeptide/nickel transport system ATPase component